MPSAQMTNALIAAQILEIILTQAAEITARIKTANSTGVDISDSELDAMSATTGTDLEKLKADAGK